MIKVNMSETSPYIRLTGREGNVICYDRTDFRELRNYLSDCINNPQVMEGALIVYGDVQQTLADTVCTRITRDKWVIIALYKRVKNVIVLTGKDVEMLLELDVPDWKEHIRE